MSVNRVYGRFGIIKNILPAFENWTNFLTKRKRQPAKVAFQYSDRESNPDLLFRRELFYPLNYQSAVNRRRYYTSAVL